MRLAPAVVLFALTALLTACASDPVTRWAQARDSLTAATVSATTAAQAGLLDDDDVLTVDVVIQAARRALAVAESQLPDGGGTFNSYLDIVEAVLVTVAELTHKE